MTNIKVDQKKFDERELAILDQIKKYYGQKLDREVKNIEAKEIAENLLLFAKTIYGA